MRLLPINNNTWSCRAWALAGPGGAGSTSPPRIGVQAGQSAALQFGIGRGLGGQLAQARGNITCACAAQYISPLCVTAPGIAACDG
ncbi:hypothetical protein D0A38_08190 [Xanthomonas campestris pv. incanae]|nr:hypothetical protein D0A38_08190 [Xanthomonas campestris pv. incanae]